MAGDTPPSIDPSTARDDRRPARRPTTCSGWRSRWTAPTCAGWPRCARPGSGMRIAGGEMTRTHRGDAGGPRRRRVRRLPAGRRPGRRHAPQPDRWPSWPWRGAAGSPRTPGRTGSGCWRTSTSRPGSAAGRSSSSRTTRRAGRPERRDAFLAEPIRPDADGMLRVPARPGLGAVRRRRRRSGGTRHDRDRAKRADRCRLDRPGGRRPAAQPRRSSTAGSCRRPRAGRSTTSPVATGASSRRSPRAASRTSTARSRRRARPSTTAAGRTCRPPTARRVLLKLAELIRAQPRRAGPPRVAGRRQADPRHAGGRRPVGGQDHPVVRRDDRQGLRRGRPDRPRRAVPRDPRADRRRRRRSCPGTTR